MELAHLQKDQQYIFDHSTNYPALGNTAAVHQYNGINLTNPISWIAEVWRLTVVNSYRMPDETTASLEFAQETITYSIPPGQLPDYTAMIGTSAGLYDPLSLELFADTPYFALMPMIPHSGEQHHCRYLADGKLLPAPADPPLKHNNKVITKARLV